MTTPIHRIVLIGGGVRSGKSAFAIDLAQRMGHRPAFVATATPSDGEMEDRIERHRQDRPETFVTFEAPLALAETLAALRGYDVVVVDCLTIWLSNLLLREHSAESILEQVDRVVRVLEERRFHAVLVTNEVGMSVHPPTPLGRAIVEVSGWTHQRVARAADRVYLAVLGMVVQIRPGLEPRHD
ncbi:MAG: bifunctional adenosylcobinamide kinase/adenosylcobinamide-phosphate guanylyltransferase, partial [Myxococcota bacterium]|nr:bifunctional adenosylcobinamide kinase/adenosylcobinamide-phosphate guanylyltransferase [Myxococcota bacterium]